MDMTPVFLIAFLVCCVFMIAYKLSHSDEGKEDSKVMQKRIEQAEAQFSPEQLNFLKTAGSRISRKKFPLIKKTLTKGTFHLLLLTALIPIIRLFT